MDNPKVSLIVPVYNEEKNLKRVLNTALKSRLFSEIICVDDGSTDRTPKILDKFKDKVKVITFRQNKGKSYAMVRGVKEAKGDIILFCDGDLVRMRKSHFQGLIEPIKMGIADQVLGIRESDFEPFRRLTGERCYWKKSLLPHLRRLEKTKFGAETYLNYAFRKKRTYWYIEPGLWQQGKAEGANFVNKVLKTTEYLDAGYDILMEMIRQKEFPVIKGVSSTIRRMSKDYAEYSNKIKSLLAQDYIKKVWKNNIRKG